jgi:hypothetical protein
MRGLFMLLFIIGFGAAQAVLNLTALLQFGWLLFTGSSNRQLSRFGGSLAKWFAEAAKFLSAASDEKPFPWKDWPAAE